MRETPRIVFTPGEPAGVGPDLAVMLAGRAWQAEVVVIADPGLLRERADVLGVAFEPEEYRSGFAAGTGEPGRISLLPLELRSPVRPGLPEEANAPVLLDAVRMAVEGSLAGAFDAVVTGPLHKGVINRAGVAFTGHTEYLAELTRSESPVMLLATQSLRVALATTHLPLQEVPDAITRERLESVLRVLFSDLKLRFGIQAPRVSVCGLNPHAGEEGHLGDEEGRVIIPVLERLREEGHLITGPLAADTAFTREMVEAADVILAMYHDQGLPVIKQGGVGRTVNITLGLPFIRTSVGHGTALELAGSGKASPDSLYRAVDAALEMVRFSSGDDGRQR